MFAVKYEVEDEQALVHLCMTRVLIFTIFSKRNFCAPGKYQASFFFLYFLYYYSNESCWYSSFWFFIMLTLLAFGVAYDTVLDCFWIR